MQNREIRPQTPITTRQRDVAGAGHHRKRRHETAASRANWTVIKAGRAKFNKGEEEQEEDEEEDWGGKTGVIRVNRPKNI